MNNQEILFKYIRSEFKGKSGLDLLEDLEVKNYTLCMDILENFDDYKKILTVFVDEKITQESLKNDYYYLKDLKISKKEEQIQEEKERLEERQKEYEENLKRYKERLDREAENHKPLTKSCIDFSGNGYHGFGNKYRGRNFK